MYAKHKIQIGKFEIRFLDIWHGKNAGMEVEVSDGEDYNSRIVDKEELLVLIKFLIEAL